MDGGTRHHVFRAPPGAAPRGRTARGGLIVNVERRARWCWLTASAPREPGLGLRSAVRGGAVPVPLARLDATVDGMATASSGEALFQPALPEQLLLSVDPQDAAVPRAIVLTARLDGP